MTEYRTSLYGAWRPLDPAGVKSFFEASNGRGGSSEDGWNVHDEALRPLTARHPELVAPDDQATWVSSDGIRF
jgi:hypothetical protein